MLAIDPKARSSMWEDLQANRKTEIEFLNDAVVELGKRHGVETPYNQLITQNILAIESGEQINLQQFLAKAAKLK